MPAAPFANAAPSELLLRKLKLCQFLFFEAHRYLRRPDPYSQGVATSLGQDAAEIFLRCLAVHHGIAIKDHESFPGLVNAVGKRFPRVLEHRAALTELNKARVNFKHHGQNVSREDALVYQSNARTFLNDVSQEVLGIDFARVSLAGAIGHKPTEALLREAETAYQDQDYMEAIGCSAKAAHTYVRHRARVGGQHEAYLRSIAIGSNALVPAPSKPGPRDQAIQALAPKPPVSLTETQALLMLLARGVDIASFYRFQALVPPVSQTQSGDFHFVWMARKREGCTRDNAQFCIQFVTELALQLRRTSIAGSEPATES